MRRFQSDAAGRPPPGERTCSLSPTSRADILWRGSDRQVAVWFMIGARFLGDGYQCKVDQRWRIKAVLSHPR